MRVSGRIICVTVMDVTRTPRHAYSTTVSGPKGSVWARVRLLILEKVEHLVRMEDILQDLKTLHR
jgi:hypothetical protein